MVTDDEILERDDFRDLAVGLLRRGGPSVAFHVRGPSGSGRTIYEHVEALVAPARDAGSVLLVNDRVDVAMVLPADGVHLGARSLAVADARALLGEGAVVGASAHSVADAVRLSAEGATFVLLGTIFPTSSHPGRPPLGLDVVRVAAVGAGSVPVVAIGGICPDAAAEVVAAGARAVAVRSGVWDDADPIAALDRYLGALTDGA